MSDGDKKPGLRDIRSLRERLGRLNAGQKAPESRSTVPAAGPFTPENPPVDGESMAESVEGATEVIQSVGAQIPDASEDMTMPVTEGDDPTGSVNSVNFDVFSKPKPANPQAGQTQSSPSAPADRRTVPAAAPAPANAQFANPLQVGQYAQPASPIDLSAEDQSSLDDFERKQQGIRPQLAIGMTLAVAMLTLVFGFLIGDVRNMRRLENAQIDASAKLKKNVKALLESLDQLSPVIDALRPGQLDLDKVAKIPTDLPGVDAGLLLGSPVPLSPKLSGILANFVGNLNVVFKTANRHRNVTLNRDRAELEAISKGSSFSQNSNFVVVYTPRDPKTPSLSYLPPIGSIYAMTGKPETNEKGDAKLIPVISRKGKESKIDVKSVLRIAKDEFITAGKANAMTLYNQRTKELKEALRKLREYDGIFRKSLKEQAAREKIFTI